MIHTILTLTLATLSFAGEVVGNGGDVIVCPGKGPQILDFYEAEVKKMSQRSDLTGSTPEEIALKVISPLKKINPTRWTIMKNQINRFQQDASFLENPQLRDIPDTNHLVLPGNCELKQLAIQIPKVLPEDPRYIVDKGLWESMDNLNKAGLIIHEVIYTDAIGMGQSNSIFTRYLTGFYFSDRLEKINELDLQRLLINKLAMLTIIDLGHKNWSWLHMPISRNGDKEERVSCEDLGLQNVTAKEVVPLAHKIAPTISKKLGKSLNEETNEGWTVGLYPNEKSKTKMAYLITNKSLLPYEAEYDRKTADDANFIYSICKHPDIN